MTTATADNPATTSPLPSPVTPEAAPAVQPIHLMHAQLDLNRLHAWMGTRTIDDLGHAIHCLTTEALGDAAPKQFRLFSSRSTQAVLYGYTNHDESHLTRNHRSFASPLQELAMPAEHLHAKPMPTQWPEGIDIAFDVRCRPLRQRRNREVDAYLSHREANPDADVSRTDAYTKWISDHFERRGGAELKSAVIQAYRQSQTICSHDRFTPMLPETNILGVVTITDSDKFAETVAAGVGRHRTYGFGMLLIRPAIREHGIPQ